MPLTRQSPCKINLLLNILGRRPDSFHELESVIQPVPLHDELQFKRADRGMVLTCNHPELAVDSTNLVSRAAAALLEKARIRDGVAIHLEKRIPLAAGLGGGSANAAHTLLGLNELFDGPLGSDDLQRIAASLGSDVPFFLQDKPALATGRGDDITPLEPFAALCNHSVLLVHPGFGIPTAWSYRKLGDFPGSLTGVPGRARKLIALLQTGDLESAADEFYNALEFPAFHKFPLLPMLREFLLENGAVVARMSGSGSTIFALATARKADELRERLLARFGSNNWTAVLPL